MRAFAARVGVTRNIVIEWVCGHHRPRSRREPTFQAAVALLRAAWRERGGRRVVLRMLPRVVSVLGWRPLVRWLAVIKTPHEVVKNPPPPCNCSEPLAAIRRIRVARRLPGSAVPP
jgi:hypothetical protein